MTMRRVAFADLRPQDDDGAVRAALARVIERGHFVLGPEVEAFEREFAAACGASHAVGVGNGTDAIALLLLAAQIAPGDEVLVPALTAAFTALGVIAAGARPVLVDVDPDTLTLDPEACAAAIGPRVAAILPVHLYGHPADMNGLRALAAKHHLLLLEDCCQAHLATCDGQPVGTFGAGGAFSFYPTKNLGAIGDGGAVVTNDAALAARVRRLRNGGQERRYEHLEPGVNSRLDEIQAAVLRARLPRLAERTARRRALARLYRAGLSGAVRVPPERDPGHVYHLFPIRAARRDALREYLREQGTETLIHYPAPLTTQPAFADCRRGDCPEAAAAAAELLSLPLQPFHQEADVQHVAELVRSFCRA